MKTWCIPSSTSTEKQLEALWKEVLDFAWVKGEASRYANDLIDLWRENTQRNAVATRYKFTPPSFVLYTG